MPENGSDTEGSFTVGFLMSARRDAMHRVSTAPEIRNQQSEIENRKGFCFQKSIFLKPFSTANVEKNYFCNLTGNFENLMNPLGFAYL